jgi:hypothetical protein
MSALSGLAAFAVININGHIFTGVAIKPSIIILAPIDKDFV